MKEPKFIADVNIEKPIVDFLAKEGYDIKWVTKIDKRLLNGQIFEIANNENRVLITNDKDFGEIVFREGKISNGIILFRIKGQDVSIKLELLKKVLATPNKIPKHFVVIKEEKIRFIPMKGV